MATEQGPVQRPGALEDLVHRLGEQAHEFTPAQRRSGTDRRVLPDRRPGAHLPEQPTSVSAAATVILDCGTSRRSGYSHVLWVSPSAEAILGSHGLDRLSEGIGRLPGVSAYEWEGLDLLHLRAAGSEWGSLLDGARSAVDAIIADHLN